MISFVRGKVYEIENDKVIIDVGGVGYGVSMSASALSKLPLPGKEILIHTYMNVKEDAMQLFGFLTKDELQLFRYIIGVSGIGPKGGLSILSKLTPTDLRLAVISGDVKAISSAPGIGKKTAEKLILELKDKMRPEDVFVQQPDTDTADLQMDTQIQGEAIQALIALGYGNSESVQAVKKVKQSESMTVEELLKAALKQMMF